MATKTLYLQVESVNMRTGPSTTATQDGAFTGSGNAVEYLDVDNTDKKGSSGELLSSPLGAGKYDPDFTASEVWVYYPEADRWLAAKYGGKTLLGKNKPSVLLKVMKKKGGSKTPSNYQNVGTQTKDAGIMSVQVVIVLLAIAFYYSYSMNGPKARTA
jgi:hypothetical protein